MKKFISSVLCVSVFFIGLGTLVEKAGAKFKSDEKALELIRAARAAIGGDNAIAAVRSMSIIGKTSHTLKINDSERTEQGDTEIALQLPDKFSKMVKIGTSDAGDEKAAVRNREVIVIGGEPEGEMLLRTGDEPGVKRVIVRKGSETGEVSGDVKLIVRKGEGEKTIVTKDGETPVADGDRVFFRSAMPRNHGAGHRNEMLSTTLGLLLSAPEGIDMSYTYAGESNVDGKPCSVVEAKTEGSAFKVYLSTETNLPVMISYVSSEMPRIIHFKKEIPPGTEPQDNVTFNAKVEGPEAAEVQVKFSDYRNVEGLQLPFHWSRTVNGAVVESLDVTSYDLNPANIADKFEQKKIFLRTKKEAQN